MASNLRVDTILPSTGTSLGIGTASGTINFLGNSQINTTGVITATSFSGSGANLTNLPAQATISNNANDRVITGGSGVNLNGEANLTFDGSTLNVNGGSTDTPLILDTTNSNGSHLRFQQNSANKHFIGSGGGFGLGGVNDLSFRTTDKMFFGVGTSQKMRMNSSGQFGIGRDTDPLNGVKLMVQNGSGNVFYTYHEGTGNNYSMLCRNDRASGSTQATQIIFIGSGNTFVGDIRSTGSATSYNTSSDYRLKENVTTISDGITRLKTLKPSRFNFISNPSQTVDGFLAHEVTAVPEAISGTKDEVVTQAMIDNGDAPSDSKLNDPIYQQIDQSKIVPLLTAALQEAITKIETLEAKVSALEGS